MIRSRLVYQHRLQVFFHPRSLCAVCRKRASMYLDRDAAIARLSSFCCFFDSQLATIVAAGGAYGVVDVVCTTIGTDSQSRHLSHVMGTTFGLAGVRLSSFRMCHILFVLLVYKLIVSSSSSDVQRWCWRRAAILGLQPPGW